jgi:hypothetical protein
MDSFSELLKRIENARERVGISKHPAWYRGHANLNYQLLPSILRCHSGLKHERNLYAFFKNQSGSMIDRNLNSWAVLAIMQHHGVPTRLLDWSESVDVALFFAISENKPNPCIWVLNPYRLNACSTGHNMIYDDADPLPFDYYTTIRDSSWPVQNPIASAPPWINERIRGQRGCFTIHGSDVRPVEELPGRFVKRVIIPTHLVKQIRDYFKQKNFGYFEIFPDLPGLAESLVRQFRLRS